MNLPIPTPEQSHVSSPNFYFPVKLAPVKALVKNRSVKSHYSAIVRTDTDQVLGICRTRRYKLISNEEAFSAIDRSLQQSTLDLNGLQVQDTMAYHGAVSIRTYSLPEYHRSVAKVGDVVELRLQCINSFNLAASFMVNITALRLVCRNGLVIPHGSMKLAMRHTNRLDIDALAQGLSQTLEVFDHQVKHWRKWSTIPITESDVDRVLKTFPQINPKLHQRLKSLYQTEVAELGETLYALLNALTFYASHEEVRTSASANKASIILQRENKVRAVINTPTWRHLANA